MRLRQGLRRRGAHARLVLLGLAALALAACVHGDPVVTGSVAAGGKDTIAFESVDGPPRPVFDRLVAALAAEAERRELAVVTRTGPSAYRVRAFLATHVKKRNRQAALAWAWEVFDSGGQRAFRLEGEEPIGIAAADVWAQLDDALLSRIAAQGFDALAARLGTPPAPVPPAAPAPAGPAIAFAGAQ